jgi:hypothetical protein
VNKRLIAIPKDDFNRVVGPEIKGSLIGGKRKLIGCFNIYRIRNISRLGQNIGG